MEIRTKENNFEYRIKIILNNLKKEYLQEKKYDGSIGPFMNWLWNNLDLLGEEVFKEIGEYINEV